MKLADVSVRNSGNAVIAAVTGEIDMSNAAEIQAALSDETPNSASGLILDFRRLDYLDSAGIQLLLRLHGALHTRAQTLVLVVPEDSVVAETFRLAGVTGRIDTETTLEQALDALAAESNPLS